MLASAIGMDKVAMKDMFRAHGLPVVDYLVVRRHEWRCDPASVERAVAQAIGFPCFAKPANLGSSVGISKVKAPEDLPAAQEFWGQSLELARKLGARQGIAISCARSTLRTVSGHHEPAFTVGSFATTTTSRS